MTVTYEGALTLGQCLPQALLANAQLATCVGLALPDVQARVTGLLALSIQPPVALLDLIAGVQATLLALQNLVAAPLPDVTATAQALVDLNLFLGQLNASLAFQAQFGLVLGAAGIRLFAYAGPANQFAPEMNAQISAGLPGGGGPFENVAGVVLLANDPIAISALRAITGLV